MSDSKTYTPAAYWHRVDDEILEPKQTITVERSKPVAPKWTRREPRVSRYQTDPVYRERVKAYQRTYQQKRRDEQSVNRDWRGVPFPERL